MSNYRREIPRDLFNEANLLKCYGQVSLHLHDRGLRHLLRWSHNNFNVVQQPYDGSLTIPSISLEIHKYGVTQNLSFFRPLNSREPWPLYANVFNWDNPHDPDDYTEIAVFNDDGTFADEMEELLK